MSKPYRVYADIKVQGVGPVDSAILAVGESPGEDEITFKAPFVGAAGEILNNCLSRNGISRESIRIDNLSHYRPWNNYFPNLFKTPFLEHGLVNIHQYIKSHMPVVVIALGNYPMHYLTGKGKKSKGGIIGIGNWRGSILPYVDDEGHIHENIKVIPTIHPAAVFRIRSLYPIFDADIKKAAQESKSRGLNYPEREFIINPEGFELIHEVETLCKSEIVTADIETTKGSTNILSISFSNSPNKGVALSLTTKIPERLQAVSKILSSPVRKCFHFGYFDSTQLKLNGYRLLQDKDSIELDRLYFFDTYIASHILQPELPHTLAFESSVRTREPYYKQEGKEATDQKGWSGKMDIDRLLRYNIKDTCVDYEIMLQQIDEITNSDRGTRNTFDFEMSCIETLNHISTSGMCIDPRKLEFIKNAMIARWAKLQHALEGLAGFEVNVKSAKDMPLWLYSKEKEGGLGLPTRYYKKKVTTNDDALVSLIAWCKDKADSSVRESTKRKYRNKLFIVRAIRDVRGIRQALSSFIESPKSTIDNRSRSQYKHGPETGRLSASKFVDGTGYNHQTHPRGEYEVSEEDYEKYKNEIKLLKELELDTKEIEDGDDDS